MREELFTQAQEKVFINDVLKACRDVRVWYFVAFIGVWVMEPLEHVRRWGLCCPRGECNRLREEEHKLVKCPRGLAGRRLHQAWPWVQKQIALFRTWSKSVTPADCEGSEEWCGIVRHMCASAASELRLAFNYQALETTGNRHFVKTKFLETENVKWYCNNAEKLPFKDNEFDYYTISFGIRNVANIDETFKEAYRVLKPGGRLLCLEFSKVENEILNTFYKIYSKTIPVMGKIILKNSKPYEYLINSIDEFYSQEKLLELLNKQNFTNTSYRNLSAGIVAIHSAWKI